MHPEKKEESGKKCITFTNVNKTLMSWVNIHQPFVPAVCVCVHLSLVCVCIFHLCVCVFVTCVCVYFSLVCVYICHLCECACFCHLCVCVCVHVLRLIRTILLFYSSCNLSAKSQFLLSSTTPYIHTHTTLFYFPFLNAKIFCN